MVRKKTLEKNDLIKCFGAIGNPFVITFADFKKCLKPVKVEKPKKRVEKKEEKKVEKPE